jgi:hypothetical protein
MAIKDFINKFRDDIRKPEKAVINPKWDANYVQLTTSQVLRLWIINKLILGKNGAEELRRLSERDLEFKRKQDPHYNPQPEKIEVYHLAVIIDDDVVDVIRASQKMADYLLLNPKFIMFSPSNNNVKPSDKYIDGKFISRNEEEATKDS